MASPRHQISSNRCWKVIITLLGLHLLGVVACVNCPDQRYFSVIDVFLENHRVISSSPIITEKIAANEYIVYDQLSIKLYTGVEYFSLQTQPSYSFLISSALACETLAPIHSENIEFFNVTSNATYIIADELSINPGESLNSILMIEFEGGQQLSLQSYLNSSDNHPMEIPIYLFLNTAPLNNQLHQFTVSYKLDSGNDFSATTEKLIITPE